MKIRWLWIAVASTAAIWFGQIGAANAFYNGPFQWSSMYFGVEGGAGWTDKDWTLGSPACCTSTGNPLGSGTGTGGFIGIEAGKDWQNGMWVYGIQGDISFGNISGDAANPNSPNPGDCWSGGDQTATCSSKLDWMADLTARIGALVMPGTLLYVKGGLAFGHDSSMFTT